MEADSRLGVFRAGLLQRLGGLLQLGDELPELGGLFLLGVHHRLRGPGDEFLVAQLLLHDAQAVFRLLLLLGNALPFRRQVHQVRI